MCYFSKLMITKERSFKPKFFCFNDLQFVSPFRCSGIVSAPWSRLPSKSSSNSVSNSNSIRFPVSKKCYSFFSHFLLLQSTFSKMQFLKFHWKSDDQDFWPTLRNLDYSFNWNSFTFWRNNNGNGNGSKKNTKIFSSFVYYYTRTKQRILTASCQTKKVKLFSRQERGGGPTN